MAATFDVAGRLAEGRPAVDEFARYASACQALGVCGHDLTDRVEAVYSSDAGLDLHALDADHAALTAAVVAVREAQQLQDSQLAALSAAWTGAGADAAAEFLRRHCTASGQAVAALSAAADQVGALRDELWRLVDAKVASAEELDARTDAVRGDWRAAAEAVTTGMGDRAAASELVDAQVAPFVERDVRAEWVAAMETATDSMAQRFESAIAAMRTQPPTQFPEPGGAWSPGVGGAAPLAPPPASVPDPAGGAPMSGTLPDMASGLSGLSGMSGGLSGLGQQLGELVGGLVPAVDDALGDGPELDAEPEDPLDLDEDDEEEPDEPEEPDEENDEEGGDEEDDHEEQDDEPDEEAEPEPDSAEPRAEPVVPGTEAPPPDPQAPAPTPAAPLAAPVTPPAPTPETPCEIAADEVPHVGE